MPFLGSTAEPMLDMNSGNNERIEPKKTSVNVKVPNEFFKLLDKFAEHHDNSRACFDQAVALARGAKIADPIIGDLIKHHFKDKKSRTTLWRWMHEVLQLEEQQTTKPKLEHKSVSSGTDDTEQSYIHPQGWEPLDDEGAEAIAQKYEKGRPVSPVAAKEDEDNWSADSIDIYEFQQRPALFNLETCRDNILRELKQLKGGGWKIARIRAKRVT